MTARGQIADIAARLQKIDWSQRGLPLEEIKLERPEIDMTVLTRDSRRLLFQFYWQGDSLVDQQSGRLLQTKLDGLRRHVISQLVALAAKTQNAKAARPALRQTGAVRPADENFVAAISPTGRRLAIAYSRSRNLMLWDVASNKFVARNTEGGQLEQIIFSPNGEILLGAARVQPTAPMSAEHWEIRRFAAGSDAAITHSSKQIRVWRFSDRE